MSVSELALISRFLGLYSIIIGYSMCSFQLAAGRLVGWVCMAVVIVVVVGEVGGIGEEKSSEEKRKALRVLFRGSADFILENCSGDWAGRNLGRPFELGLCSPRHSWRN